MSEVEPGIPNHETVFGGTMDAYEFYQAEFEISEEMPVWVEPDVIGLNARINGQPIVLSRLNTKVYNFGKTQNEDGFEGDYRFMSHIYIHMGEGKKPVWYMRPEDPDELKEWKDLAKRLREIKCDWINGLPKTLDFEQTYHMLRGNEDIETVIARLLLTSGEPE